MCKKIWKFYLFILAPNHTHKKNPKNQNALHLANELKNSRNANFIETFPNLHLLRSTCAYQSVSITCMINKQLSLSLICIKNLFAKKLITPTSIKSINFHFNFFFCAHNRQRGFFIRVIFRIQFALCCELFLHRFEFYSHGLNFGLVVALSVF